MKYGYARVSTDDQNTALQLGALKKAGCKTIFKDEGISGATTKRPSLTRCLNKLRSGDTLIVWKLDRLGRSLRDLITMLDELRAQGVKFRSLTEHIDTETAAGRAMWQMIGVLAEEYRKFKRHFHPAAATARLRWQRLSAAWTGGSGWVTVEPQGFLCARARWGRQGACLSIPRLRGSRGRVVEVRMGRPDRTRDSIKLVPPPVNALKLAEHAVLSEDLVDGRAPARGVVCTEDVVKIAGQQRRDAVGHDCLLSHRSRERARRRPRRDGVRVPPLPAYPSRRSAPLQL